MIKEVKVSFSKAEVIAMILEGLAKRGYRPDNLNLDLKVEHVYDSGGYLDAGYKTAVFNGINFISKEECVVNPINEDDLR